MIYVLYMVNTIQKYFSKKKDDAFNSCIQNMIEISSLVNNAVAQYDVIINSIDCNDDCKKKINELKTSLIVIHDKMKSLNTTEIYRVAAEKKQINNMEKNISQIYIEQIEKLAGDTFMKYCYETGLKQQSTQSQYLTQSQYSTQSQYICSPDRIMQLLLQDNQFRMIYNNISDKNLVIDLINKSIQKKSVIIDRKLIQTIDELRRRQDELRRRQDELRRRPDELPRLRTPF